MAQNSKKPFHPNRNSFESPHQIHYVNKHLPPVITTTLFRTENKECASNDCAEEEFAEEGDIFSFLFRELLST